MQSSGREVVASATAHVASVFGCAASSFVGRARVPATRTYVYAVLGAYHEDDVRTNCPISLSKWRFPPIPQSVTFLPAGSASSRVLSGPTDAEAEHEFPTNSGALVELPTSLCSTGPVPISLPTWLILPGAWKQGRRRRRAPPSVPSATSRSSSRLAFPF